MKEHEIELELVKLMKELQIVSKELEIAISPYLKIVEENLKKQEEVSEPYSIKCVELQEKIKKLTMLRAKSLKTGSGNITYVKGSVRRSWDLDKLDNICKENKDIKDKIWSYRKEDDIDPQVRIKVDINGKSVTEL